MTYIQPHQSNKFFITILALFGVCLIVSVVWLVILYNQIVNLRHSISDSNSSFQKVQATNAELKDDMLSLFDDVGLQKLASEQGLVKEKKPEYQQVKQQWVFALER